MLDIEGLTLTPADRDLLREPAVGGVILFTRNYESPAQLADLVAAIRAVRSPIVVVILLPAYCKFPAMHSFLHHV